MEKPPLVDCGGDNYISSGIGPKGRTCICHVFHPGEKQALCGEYALRISSIVRVLVFLEGWKNLTLNVWEICIHTSQRQKLWPLIIQGIRKVVILMIVGPSRSGL